MAEISPLRRRMIEDMTVRNLSPATQRSYLAAVSKLSRYFGRSPDCLELEDIRGPLGDILPALNILAGAQSDRVCATLFLRCDARPRCHSRAHQLCTPVL